MTRFPLLEAEAAERGISVIELARMGVARGAETDAVIAAPEVRRQRAQAAIRAAKNPAEIEAALAEFERGSWSGWRLERKLLSLPALHPLKKILQTLGDVLFGEIHDLRLNVAPASERNPALPALSDRVGGVVVGQFEDGPPALQACEVELKIIGHDRLSFPNGIKAGCWGGVESLDDGNFSIALYAMKHEAILRTFVYAGMIALSIQIWWTILRLWLDAGPSRSPMLP